MGKTVAITQPNYIPWKGYFDLIGRVDEFILLNDVQYTKRDWRNRNLIKTASGPHWLSIPVVNKKRYAQLICETEIADPAWAEAHWRNIHHAYRKAAHFEAYRDGFAALYRKAAELPLLWQVNQLFLQALCELLAIDTPLRDSRDYAVSYRKGERILALCRAAGATHYLSGPSARAYLDHQRFAACGVEILYMDYQGYPPYRQLYPPFEHRVSVIDLIFNQGGEADRYLRHRAPDG